MDSIFWLAFIGVMFFGFGLISSSLSESLKKDKRFLLKAYQLACLSQDPSTQIGAIIVKKDKILGQGFNHLPEKIDRRVWHNREKKLKHVVHAEKAAILDAKRKGNDIRGATMYMPWTPCQDCAKAIVKEKLFELVVHKKMVDKTPDNWKKDCDKAREILLNGDVRYTVIKGDLNGPSLRFRGEYWRP